MTPPRLRVVDADTGEINDCPGCAELADVVAGLERDVRGWAVRYRILERDHEAEAREDELWDEAEALFGHWKLRCHHPRSQFTVDRFDQVRPYLKKYGAEVCRRAIDGAAYDPYTVTRKNGSLKRFDGWELIFKTADKLEDFANRAPR